MNNMEGGAQPPQSPPSRRNFLRGVGLFSAFAALASLAGRMLPGKRKTISCAPEKKMVRMLTQEGRLVEVDGALLPPGLYSGQTSGQPLAGGKKISNEELQNWIKKSS